MTQFIKLSGELFNPAYIVHIGEGNGYTEIITVECGSHIVNIKMQYDYHEVKESPTEILAKIAEAQKNSPEERIAAALERIAFVEDERWKRTVANEN